MAQATTYTDDDVTTASLDANTSTTETLVFNVLGGAANYDAARFGTGPIFVGDYRAFNSLTIQNGADLRSTNATIGWSGDADHNRAVITGSGSTWTASGQFTVGYSGAQNSLLIESGGSLTSGDWASIGDQTGANGNAVVLNGTGAMDTSTSWTTVRMYVGNDGNDNTLVVRNGADLTNTDTTFIGRGGAGNSVSITGAGSTWTAGNINVGAYGSNNRLSIADGATVTSKGGILGNDTGSGNVAVVAGAGSSWTMTNPEYRSFFVGWSGSGNTLQIAGGGLVRNYDATIGRYAGSSNNSVLVTGAGSTWINDSHLTIGHADNTANALTVANGGLAIIDGTFTINSDGDSINQLLFAGGFVALKTDLTGSLSGLLLGGRSALWDGSSFVTGASMDDFSFTFADAGGEAAAFLGSFASDYAGLLGQLDSGYTLITAGSAIAVPEPSTWALLIGSAALGIAVVARRRANCRGRT